MMFAAARLIPIVVFSDGIIDAVERFGLSFDSLHI